MNLDLNLVAWGAGALVLAAILIYAASRFYIVRADRTFMTHDEKDFRRGLRGWGIIWNPLESVVRGSDATALDYPSWDYAAGQPRVGQLRNPKTGAISLRPHYCRPPAFAATTLDNHRVIVEANVQFSLNKDLLRYVYQLDDFGYALVMRIQNAFRAKIGEYRDEEMRAALAAIEHKVIEHLREGERAGDEIGEQGLAIGVTFHSASFTFAEFTDEAALSGGLAATSVAAVGEGGVPEAIQAAARIARTQGVAAIKPQELDRLADVFQGRSPESTQALLAILDMQTRQNIAEALARSGQLVIVTPQELGLASSAVQLDAMRKSALRGDEPAPPAIEPPKV